MKKKYIALIVLLLLIGSAIAILLLHPEKPENLLSDDTAQEWQGDQPLYNPQDKAKMIDIPGITSLVFKPDEKNQKVNLYNPETNDCLFRFNLIVDDKQYWQSGFCAPGHGYYDIELDETIPGGTYTAYMLVECFKEDGTKLNGANVEFQLEVR